MNIELGKTFRAYITLVGCTVLLTSAHKAQAHGSEFRDFQQQNPGIDRHVARNMFHSERRNHTQNLPAPWNQTTGIYNRGGHRHHYGDVSTQSAKQQSLQLNQSGDLARLNKGVDLDLTSNATNIVLGKNLFDNGVSIQIEEGGKVKTVSAGSQVTAAEYVAVKQVLAGGGQKVTLDNAGRAAGGQVDLSEITANNDVMRASELVVASNVTTYGDFGKRSDFRLLGNLDNYGNVITLNTVGRSGGTIYAADINNHSHAEINSTVDLSLNASGNLTNEGTITSDGNLSIVAGGAINNSGRVASSSNLDLNAPNINNRGVLQSVYGNVNLDAPSTAAFAVNNERGTISALNGAINSRATTYDGSANTSITGGDLLSRQLNLNSGTGLTSVAVGQLTGQVNETGTAAHVLASTDVLNIGNICLTGDPTFYNTAGDINVTSNVSVGEPLTIVALGNINVSSGVSLIAGNTSQGFGITLIAGAGMTPISGSNSPTIPPTTNNGAVALSGKTSKTGGNIVFGTNTNITAQAQGGSGTTNGGDVSLYAFGGKDRGQIDVGGATIKTGGSSGGSNGKVALLSLSKAPNAVITGVIDTTGGSGGGGDLGIATVGFSGKGVTYNSDGSLGSPLPLLPSLKPKPTKGAGVIVSDRGVAAELNIAGNLGIAAGSTVTISGDMVSQGTTGITSDGDVTGAGTISAGTGFTYGGKGSVGTMANPLSILTPSLDIKTSGAFASVLLPGSGTTLVNSISAATNVNLVAPNGTVGIVQSADADNVSLSAFQFNNFNISGASDSISITETNPSAPTFQGGFGNTDNLNLNIASGIGSSTSNPFHLQGGLGQVTLTAPTIFAIQDASSKDTRVSLNAVTHAHIETLNNIGLTITDSNVSSGILEVLAFGTLTISGNVTARDEIDLYQNSAKTSTKFIVEANSQIKTNAIADGQGNILMVLGNNFGSQDFSGAIANVTQSVTTGSGPKTSVGHIVFNTETPSIAPITGIAPTNTLNAKGAYITISNIYSAKNFVLGGNVLIQADP